MKRKLLTLSTIVLSAGVAMGDAVPLAGQVYSDDEYAGLGYFANVQFKSNVDDEYYLYAPTPGIGHDSSSPNLLDDANNFSIKLDLKDFAIAPDHYFGGPIDNVPVRFIGTSYDDPALWVGLTCVDSVYYWTIEQENGSFTSTGKVFDGAAGEYIFRSGEDFMDVWRVIDGKAELLVTHNEALIGSHFDIFNSEVYSDQGSDFVFGEEFSKYLRGSHIKSATLYNGLYVADGVGGSAAAVPEPTTATLSLLALAGLAARRRRR